MYNKKDQITMKTIKHCPECNNDLPIKLFSSKQARSCNNCKIFKAIAQRDAMQQRRIDQLEKAIKHRKRKKTGKRDPKKTLENKLDKLAPKICRQQGYCSLCKKTSNRLNAHHYKSRKYKGVRWYLPNLICLCAYCHTFNTKFSAHKTPESFKKEMRKRNGQAWHNDIEKRAKEHTSWSLEGLKELYEELKKKDV